MDCFRIKCANCSEDYSDERVPRTLKCGHSLCTSCSEQFITGEKTCPECHEKQSIKYIDPPINYPVLRVIKSLAVEKVGVRSVKTPAFFVDVPSSDIDKAVCKCCVHGSPILFFCCSCNAWVCHDCLVVDHPFLPRGSCRILGLSDVMNLLRSKHKDVANNILNDVETMKRNFDFEMAIHDFCLKYCSDKRDFHVYLTEQTESQLEEVKKHNNSVVEKVKECVSKSMASAETTESPEEMTAFCKELNDCQNDLKDIIEKSEESKLPVLEIMLQHLRLDLKMLVLGRIPVYVVTDEGKGSRWAQITVKENRILLYCLNDGRPPKEGITIPFEYAKKLYPKGWTTVFFEVGTEEEELGRIYARFIQESPLVEQMNLMCSGEKGVSHKGTCLYKLEKEEGILHAGDYENNDGTGGKPLVEGLDDSDAVYVYRKVVGTIMGDRKSTRFNFKLENIKRGSYSIGNVTLGLKVLKSLNKVRPARKIIIRDCGIVIPMTIKKCD